MGARDGMDTDSGTTSDGKPDVPLLPAAGLGFLLYPYAVQLILAHPPANDLGPAPSAAR
jgi:hypothetical protein